MRSLLFPVAAAAGVKLLSEPSTAVTGSGYDRIIAAVDRLIDQVRPYERELSAASIARAYDALEYGRHFIVPSHVLLPEAPMLRANIVWGPDEPQPFPLNLPVRERNDRALLDDPEDVADVDDDGDEDDDEEELDDEEDVEEAEDQIDDEEF